MNSAKTDTSFEESPTPRKAGRRPKSQDGVPAPSRTAIIQCAVELARNESIDDVSMVRVARELGVAPGLVHYYLGGRDDLLSAVINHAFKERMQTVPTPTGDWRTDLEGVAKSVLVVTLRWPGLGKYIMTRNRFRLFQRVDVGEADYGLAFFDHVGQLLQNAGFSPAQAALAFHLLMTFVMSMALERECRQSPSAHHDFIVGYVSRFDQASVPGASFIAEAFAELDGDTTFKSGLTLLLDGFESWRVPAPKAPRRRAAAR